MKEYSPRHVHRLFRRIGLLIFITLFILVTFEIGLRLLHIGEFKGITYQEDLKLGWRFVPKAVVELSKGRERLNSKGYRGPEYDYHKKDGVLRIVTIGDSCTFGVFLDKDEKTYPRQMEAMLHEKNLSADKNIEVFNFGVQGYGTFHGKTLMEKEVPEVKPDIVIGYFGWNDRLRIVGWFDHSEKVSFLNSQWHNFATVRVFFRITDELVKNLRISSILRKIMGDQWIKNGQTLKQVERNLTDIIRRAKEIGAVPILVTTPSAYRNYDKFLNRYLALSKDEQLNLGLSEEYYAYQLNEYNKLVREVAKRRGVELIDFASIFLSIPEDKREFYFHENDVMHPNEHGCKLIAEYLTLLIEQILSKSKI